MMIIAWWMSSSPTSCLRATPRAPPKCSARMGCSQATSALQEGAQGEEMTVHVAHYEHDPAVDQMVAGVSRHTGAGKVSVIHFDAQHPGGC